MANSTVSDLVGSCIPPFLDASKFGDGGCKSRGSSKLTKDQSTDIRKVLSGRLCAPIQGLPGKPTCCLPCPATDWTYSEDFKIYGTVAEWLNVFGLALLAFMLVSYFVLPVQQTRRHYLSICLVLSIAMIALGFTIPLGIQPEQCYDAITPNDMKSSMPCAWSGAFIIAGGLSTGMWVFIRALSMNLQICWDIVPGRKFFYASQLLGWGISAILFAVTMTLTGVSFRFGSACHVNHGDSMGDFWGPLLALAGAAGILQLSTFGYCIHVYLKNLWSDPSQTSTSHSGSGLPSYTGSIRAQTARAVYQRLRKVLWLQWRGICIVSIILVDVVFFSIVFVYLDGIQSSVVRDWTKIMPWLTCLAAHPTDKDQCLYLVRGWLISEPTVVAVLLLLSLAGLQVFLLLTRPSVFPAWWDRIRSKPNGRQEFISLDARPDIVRSNSKQGLLKHQHGHVATTFEMQAKQPYDVTTELDDKGFSPAITSPEQSYRSPGRDSPMTDTAYDGPLIMSPQQPSQGRLSPDYVGRMTPSPATGESPSGASTMGQGQNRSDYFNRSRIGASLDARRYQAPTSSFSAPKAPSRDGSVKSVSFDPRDLYSRGGLALNPPSEADESSEYLDLHHSHL